MRIFLCLLSLFLASSASADGFKLVGRASLFTNDYLGDGEDRWRTGSYTRSTFFARSSGKDATAPPLFELRLRGEVIAPTEVNLVPQPGERPFVGVAAIGGFRHVSRGDYDVAWGGEMVFVGPQTGVSSFVTEAHEALGFKQPRAASGQLGNNTFPTVYLHASRLAGASATVPFDVRPFVEVQAGAETYARIGVDMFFGNGMSTTATTRDVVSGQIMSVVAADPVTGFTPSIGFDVARVWDSQFLPSSSGLTVKPWRLRARGGLRSQTQSTEIFYGLSWLSPEYEGQPSGQVLGSLSLDFQF